MSEHREGTLFYDILPVDATFSALSTMKYKYIIETDFFIS